MPEPLAPDTVRSNPAARRSAPRLPGQRRLIGWVYTGRLAAVLALLVRGTWELGNGADVVLVASLVLAITLLFTGGSYWYTHRHGRTAGTAFLVGQVAYDVALVSIIVFLTGGGGSILAPLYILVICAAAVLLPFFGGLAVGAITIALYFLVVALSAGETGALGLQMTLFAVVALVTSYLGERLRETGTALGEVETQLRQLRVDTTDILSTIGTGILTVDGEGKLLYMNPAAEELLRISAASASGAPVIESLDRVAPGLGEVIQRTSSGRTPIRRFETRPIHEDGSILGVSTTLVEREGSAGPPAVTAIFQDITQKMRVEALRRRSERLEAVAELSASLAHEIKNPLASIRSAVEQIGGGEVDEADSRLLTNLVVRESDRLSRLLTEFIDFARVKVISPEPIELPEIAREVVELVRAHPEAHGVEISLHVAGDPAQMRVRGAEDVLHRAVLNLVLNAAQWSPEGGRVDLRLDEVSSDLLSPALGALGLVRLTVTDGGPGIDEEILEDIFNPFFTRRPGGTGLGLALVQRAVEAHGGAVFVDNAAPGTRSGATFSLYLPALHPEAQDTSFHPSVHESRNP
jgi:two-component system, NtrC family, sensor histidine kinase PilS